VASPEPPRGTHRRRRGRGRGRTRRIVLAALVLAVLGAGAGALWWFTRDDTLNPVVADVTVARQGPGALRAAALVPRSVDAYAGQGAWVDAFDFSPPYTRPNPPVVTPAVIGDMADHGVRTLYLQASRIDARSPDVLEDRWLLAEFLLRAHARNMRVVGWFLPKWGDDTSDIDRLRAITQFSVLGQRFDGVAVDIEYVQDGLDPPVRNQRLLALSQALRQQVGGDALGAIVLPPVATEVINPKLWPDFPWAGIKPYYDVWLPMSYWSNRTTRSGYKDGYRYTAENVSRLRTDLADANARVHAVGGIGAVNAATAPTNTDEPMAVIGDLDGFVRALREARAIGGSIYDWRTTDPAARDKLRDLLAVG
jgi:hypothetical protein